MPDKQMQAVSHSVVLSPGRNEQCSAAMWMQCVNDVPFVAITTIALVCVGKVVTAGGLFVVTAVFISTVLRMTSAVQTEVSLALLVCLYHGECGLDQVAHKHMTVNA